MSGVPTASIVIVSWNGRQFLEPCLNAVAAQQGVEAETILVDNGSSDGTGAFVRERFPWVRLVALGENRGFAGGNNAGAREARGDRLAVVDADGACRGRAGDVTDHRHLGLGAAGQGDAPARLGPGAGPPAAGDRPGVDDGAGRGRDDGLDGRT
jgi:hypothetical protein